MQKHIFGLLLGLLSWSSACLAADLTALEMRWLRGVWPVVVFAKAAGMPLDISVQPQPTPGAAPLALGFVGGRCKLVLSMRDNPEAQASLDRIETDLLAATLELMAAHELGHCRRYLEGNWLARPAGFSAILPEGLSEALTPAYVNMKAQQREEAFADLVGLAWVQQHHGLKYARLHAWLVAERSNDLQPGSEHDTLAWINKDLNLKALANPSIFAAADTLWTTRLSAAD